MEERPVKSDVDHPAAKYCRSMDEIRDRLRALYCSELAHGQSGGAIADQSVMLNVRMILELISYSTLLANENLDRQLIDNDRVQGNQPRGIEHLTRAEGVLRKVERANPDFFPVPLASAEADNEELHIADWDHGGLAFSKQEWVELYEFVNEHLHVRNPFSLAPPLTSRRTVKEWADQLHDFLLLHRITLLGGESAVVRLGELDGRTNATFRHVGPPDQQEFEWGR